MSLRESDGFFDFPDSTWRDMKRLRVDQMCMQATSFRNCTGIIEKPCKPGCQASLTGCKARTYWQTHYEPSFSCILDQRVGISGDGGKWVCDAATLARRSRSGEGCLVYSIGSNGRYSFEDSVHTDISKDCEVHTIDMNPWSHYTKDPPPPDVSYHVYTLGMKPAGTPLSDIVKALGHKNRVIDIFKIDCEGCEWSTYKSWFGAGVQMRQILIELHPSGLAQAHDFFKFLFDMGYVVFHKEPNTLGCSGDCIEYAFVKVSPNFSRAVSA